MSGDQVKLWIAEGFGTGRVPKAPGTAGSLVGIPWLLVLLLAGSPIVFFVGMGLGAILSVWLCGEGERISGKHDPGSIVIDEIIAIPMCLIAWLVSVWVENAEWPGFSIVQQPESWLVIGAAWVLFRVFDIWKPWPIRQSQVFAGGFGVTIDDVLAAVYVNLVMLPFLL